MKLGMRRGPPGPAEASRDRPPRRLEAFPDAILVELVQDLSGSGGFRELLALAARGVLEAVPAQIVGVGVCGDAALHGVALEVRNGHVSEPSGFELPLYPKLANWMQAAECTVIPVFDPAQARDLPSILLRFRALAAFPLRFENRTHGLILMGFEEPRALSEEEIKQTKTVAGITAMAIGQARAERAQSPQEQASALLERIEAGLRGHAWHERGAESDRKSSHQEKARRLGPRGLPLPPPPAWWLARSYADSQIPG